MISSTRQNPASAFDKAVCQAIAAFCFFTLLAGYNSNFTTAGLLSSRSNPFRTQTVTGRDGAGRIQTQAVTAGSATPLSETQTWLADGRLDTYSAVRVGANSWDEFRDYDYNSRGYLTKESFAPRPSASEELTYGFDALGLRTSAKVGVGGNSNWFANVTSVYTTREVAVDSINDAAVAVPASGVAFGAARVELEVDGVPGPAATHPGWQDATGAWSANLTLSPGQHALAARAVHPSGWKTDPVTNTFTVNGTPQTVTNYSYDQVGNLAWRSWSGGKDQVFTWDANGRLVSVADYAGGYLASTWTAAYDGFGRRLRTTTTPYGGATTTISSFFDPQAEFLEIGVNVNGAQHWKVHGPDLNGAFGALNGTGGLEAVISPEGTTGAINDAFGNVVASVGANNTVTWSPVKVGSYGPLPNSTGRTLESGATLIEASAWRNRRLDPTGYINLGARHYDPATGRFICPDPLGHSSSWSLYDFASADGVNNFDGDGRLATQAIMADGRMRDALAQGAMDYAMWDLKFVSGALGFLKAGMPSSSGYGNGTSTQSLQRLANLSQNDFSPTGLVLNKDLSVNPEKLGGTLAMVALPILLEKPWTNVATPAGQSTPSISIQDGVPVGTNMTRNFGGESGLYGQSWTTDVTRLQSRNSLGLETNNSAEFVAHGTVVDNTGIVSQKANPWGRFAGGGDEKLVPDSQKQIQIEAVTMPDEPLPWSLATDPRELPKH